MKTIIIKQSPIADCPEYDTVVERTYPEPMDLATWAEEVRTIIEANLTLDESFVVRHVAMCSTPPTKAGLYPPAEVKAAQDLLVTTYGVGYVLRTEEV